MKSLSSFRPLLRAQLRSYPANGHATFTPHIRKLVFEYCDKWPSSANTRTYIHNHIESLARAYPHVEIVVKQRTYKEPIIRGFYESDSSEWVRGHWVEKKVQLLLDSSGAKIRALKKAVESTTEAPRGIWSGMHADRPRL
ncbi:hypothetical protein BDZ89DRAFT_1128990 [Hymenopellis radicata]|nr:hypothetical protein BDZ89DRAFT_1128990 [Hymenopellis radicata]